MKNLIIVVTMLALNTTLVAANEVEFTGNFPETKIEKFEITSSEVIEYIDSSIVVYKGLHGKSLRTGQRVYLRALNSSTDYGKEMQDLCLYLGHKNVALSLSEDFSSKEKRSVERSGRNYSLIVNSAGKLGVELTGNIFTIKNLACQI